MPGINISGVLQSGASLGMGIVLSSACVPSLLVQEGHERIMKEGHEHFLRPTVCPWAFTEALAQLILAMSPRWVGCAHFMDEEIEDQSCQACLSLPGGATHPDGPIWQVMGLGQVALSQTRNPACDIGWAHLFTLGNHF